MFVFDDHQRYLSTLVFHISGLGHSTIRPLIESIRSQDMPAQLSHFWDLQKIQYNKDPKELHKYMNKWLLDVVDAFIPDDCHPLISAIFHNDVKEVIDLTKEDFPYFSLVFTSPTQGDPQSVPSYFQNKTYKFGDQEISGSAIWALIMGDITPLLPYKLHWLLIYALLFWYYLRKGGLSVFAGEFYHLNDQHLKSQSREDPLFYQLCFMEDKKIDDVVLKNSSLLPPLDALFYLFLNKTRDPSSVTYNAMIIAIKNAASILLRNNYMKEAAYLLNLDGYDNNVSLKKLAKFIAVPTLNLTEEEKSLFSKSDIDTSKNGYSISKCEVYNYKGTKARLLYSTFQDNEKGTECLATATDLFLKALKHLRLSHGNDGYDQDENYQKLFFIAYSLGNIKYMRRMIKNGKGLEKLYEWKPFFEQDYKLFEYLPDQVSVIDILTAIRTADDGADVDRDLLVKIANLIKEDKSRFSFRFRYYLAGKFMSQQNAMEIFGMCPGPKDKLIEITDSSFY